MNESDCEDWHWLNIIIMLHFKKQLKQHLELPQKEDFAEEKKSIHWRILIFYDKCLMLWLWKPINDDIVWDCKRHRQPETLVGGEHRFMCEISNTYTRVSDWLTLSPKTVILLITISNENGDSKNAHLIGMSWRRPLVGVLRIVKISYLIWAIVG